LRKRCRSIGVVKSRYSIDGCGHACSEGEGYAEENQSNDYAKRQPRHETNFRHIFSPDKQQLKLPYYFD